MSKLAAADYPLPVPRSEPCPLCGRDYFVGQHLVRARAGEKCRSAGGKAKLFEACVVAGTEVAYHCLGGHRVRV